MTSVMLKFYFRAASSQSSSFVCLSVDQWQNSAFSTRKMKSHLSYPCEGSWFYWWRSGSGESDIRLPLHQPLSLMLPALTHPYQASKQVHLLSSDSWETQLVPLSPCHLPPFIPHCKLPAFCLCAEGEGVPTVPAGCSTLAQRKSKCLSGSLVCVSLLCLQLSREVLLQLELMPWNTIFQGWV